MFVPLPLLQVLSYHATANSDEVISLQVSVTRAGQRIIISQVNGKECEFIFILLYFHQSLCINFYSSSLYLLILPILSLVDSLFSHTLPSSSNSLFLQHSVSPASFLNLFSSLPNSLVPKSFFLSPFPSHIPSLLYCLSFPTFSSSFSYFHSQSLLNSLSA